MVNHKSKSDDSRYASPVNITRHHKVNYIRQYPDYIPMPLLILEGPWLAAAGFTIGTMADIQVMKGCLVITTGEPELTEPALSVPANLLPACQRKHADEDRRETVGECVA